MNESIIYDQPDEWPPSNSIPENKAEYYQSSNADFAADFDQALLHARRHLVLTDRSITTDDCYHHLNELARFHFLEVQQAAIPKLRPWTDDNKPTESGEYWVLFGAKRKPILFWLDRLDIRAGSYYGEPYTFWSPVIQPIKP
jgi:hypothetical protein